MTALVALEELAALVTKSDTGNLDEEHGPERGCEHEAEQ